MLIKQPPMTVEISNHVCPFHKKHPGKSYAGCTCSGSIVGKVKPRNEWTEEESRHFYGYTPQ